MDRRRFVAFIGGALAAPLRSFAQPKPAKVARIGFLGLPAASSWTPMVEALRTGLRELGYVEGRNILIEFRWAEGNYDRLPGLAAELVRLNVDLIVTHTTLGTRVAKQATTTIPIVIAATGDAVQAGLVASFARPGGNVTGSSFLGPEIVAKRWTCSRKRCHASGASPFSSTSTAEAGCSMSSGVPLSHSRRSCTKLVYRGRMRSKALSRR